MGFWNNVGNFLQNPVRVIDHGFDVTEKAKQAGISQEKIDRLEDAGASDEEINAAVTTARDRNKNNLLAQVRGDAPAYTPEQMNTIGTPQDHGFSEKEALMLMALMGRIGSSSNNQPLQQDVCV